MSKEEKTPLGSLKELEEVKKKRLLAKLLTSLKEDSKEVMRLKKSCELSLELAGIDKKESKSIIDWINSLVELTEEDVKDIKMDLKNEQEENKREIEKKIEEAPYSPLTYMATACNSDSALAFNSGTTNLVYSSCADSITVM